MGSGITQVTAFSPRQDGDGLLPGGRDTATDTAITSTPGAVPGSRATASSGMRPGSCVIPGNGRPADAAPCGPGVLSGSDVLPVLPALRELLPGGLPRGSVVATGSWSLLCLVLAASASIAGGWCAIAGVPDLGVAAAADAGLDPGRLLLIADPGEGWPQVVASLLDGCELVLLRPPARPSAQVRRRLEAVARRHGGVLVVAGDWDGAQCRLIIARQEWTGIEAGHGRLCARLVQVVADGRGAAGRSRAQWLWLPGPDGAVAVAAAGIGGPAADGPAVGRLGPGRPDAGWDGETGEAIPAWRGMSAG